MASATPLGRADWGLLAGYCCVLFGVALISGRPLTLHESVLPQSAREMFADGDWIVPKKGGEPWLESPPLPQWCTVATASVFGRCDTESIVRLGPLLVATMSVCLTAWMASVWYGRTIGLFSGLILATTFQFTRYAWLAEDEIYLCGVVTAAVAWFIRLEFVEQSTLQDRLAHQSLPSLWLGSRPWQIVVLFVLLGLTNLVKGLFFGTAMAAIPMAGWLLWNRDWLRISKYLWVWGGLCFMTILAAWPIAAWLRYPDVLPVWFRDLGGRVTGEYHLINQPLWYYPVNLLWMLAPWTIVVPFGMAATWADVKAVRNSPARFLWGWAFLVPLVFSIPGGKHHHYLLHALAPWAVLSAVGLAGCRRWLESWPRWLVHPLTGMCTLGLPLMIALAMIQSRSPLPGPAGLYYGLLAAIPLASWALTWGLHHPVPRVTAVVVFATLCLGYVGGHWFAGNYVDVNRHDVALLQQTSRLAASRGEPIVVDLSRTPLSGFLELFYLPAETRSIHNVSFLVEDRLPRELLLLTHVGELEALAQFGEVAELGRSDRTLRTKDESSRLVLCSVRLTDALPRKSAIGVRTTPMQAMHRAEGPVLR